MTSSYDTALSQHDWAMQLNMVVRIRCDNASNPHWWAEAFMPKLNRWVPLSRAS